MNRSHAATHTPPTTIAIESGAISAEGLRSQILSETAPFFSGPAPADALFGIRVWTTTRT